MMPRLEVGGKKLIQPIPMTRFWHRRICEATAFISFVIIAVFLLSEITTVPLVSDLVSIGTPSVIIAGLTFVVSIVSYFMIPKTKLAQLTFVNYALLTVSIASIVLTTGESTSPLIGLWIAVSVFAGVFGWYGFSLILLLVAAYSGYGFLYGVSPESIVIATAASITPLIASFIIWHSKSAKDTSQTKAYTELATELSQEANKSETVIGAINDGVVSVDKQGVIQLINPAAQRIIGWGQNDAVGLSYKSVVKLLDPADKPISTANDPVEKVLATNQEVHSEDFSVQTEGGKKILLSLIVSPIGTPSTGAIMVFRDMTKEKAEEREQAEFISTASHEMRTPVASIEGYLGLALNPATATIDDKARDYIQKAQASAQHLGRLFQDLLDVSKAEDGRMTNDPSVVDMVDFVGMVADGLKSKATDKGLRFLYKPQPTTPGATHSLAPVFYTHVDNDHLREVIANLIENAIKYTLKGDVVVDVTGDDTHVSVSVQDSGIGIPAEDIPHLFQKFYRVDNSDTREIGGTGLGLFLCRRLAELMGGQITVTSEYKKGSTFSLILPRIDHSEAARLMEASAATVALDEGSPAQVATAPQPAVAPSPQPTPQVVASPVIAQPQPITPQAPNVPLSQIEQNPAAYRPTPRPAIQIPVRDSTEQQS